MENRTDERRPRSTRRFRGRGLMMLALMDWVGTRVRAAATFARGCAASLRRTPGASPVRSARSSES
jgi:hypothetical protein